MKSIKVPFDRAHPDAQPVKISNTYIYFNGRGWSSKWKKPKISTKRSRYVG
jgi:hypothetical protein